MALHFETGTHVTIKFPKKGRSSTYSGEVVGCSCGWLTLRDVTMQPREGAAKTIDARAFPLDNIAPVQSGSRAA